MQLLVQLWLLVCIKFMEATDWATVITSRKYDDTRLVMESRQPFTSQYFSKVSSVSSTTIACSKICASNATCKAFNFYPTNTQYVCEFVHENLCSNKQRVALQIWPGGTVWDKLSPGANQSCIEQQFAGKANASFCEIGRSGCRSTWPDCNTCVKSCSDCYTTYGTAGLYNCTLWPQGPSMPPIFAFCEDRSTILVKRQVNLYNGTVWPDYNMSLPDMHRLSNLSIYTSLTFNFKAFGGKNYTANYRNFYINGNGSLMNMSCNPVQGGCGGAKDGFDIGAQKTLKPSPFLWVPANSTCGSFWWLNSTQGGLSTTNCPGGGVGLFGSVDVSSTDVKYKRTGIRWPQATKEKKTLVYTDMKMDI